MRWAISRTDAPVLMVAAIWSYWPGVGEQAARLSFSLLTMNSDHHPVLRRFHGPEDEKRSLIHVTPDHWDAWLDAKPTEAPAFSQLPPEGVLHTEVAPSPPRKRKAELPLGFVEED